MGDRQHIPVKIHLDAQVAIEPVDIVHHLSVAAVAGLAIGFDGLLEGPVALRRDAVDRHVGDAGLIRVVQLAGFQARALEGDPQFHAAGHPYARQLACPAKLQPPSDGIVIHDAGGLQARLPGKPHGGGGGIGAEGIKGMDVVVGELGPGGGRRGLLR